MHQLFFALLPFFFLIQQAGWCTPAQVLIITQAETNPVTNTLMPQGEERSGGLGQYIPQFPGLLTFGPPVAIFVSRTSNPALQTATPISETLAIPIHRGFGPETQEELIRFVLTNNDYHGKEVLIVWDLGAGPGKGNALASLVEGFGFALPNAANVYPYIVYILNFPHTPGVVAARISQELLYGDPSTGSLPPY